MTDDEAIDRLEDLEAALDAEARQEVVHPTTEEIVALASDGEGLHPDERAWLESHVAECSTCQEEVERTRGVLTTMETTGEPEAAPRETSTLRWRRMEPVLAMAAGLAVVALAYPAFLGLTRYPGVAREVRDLRDENARLESASSDLRDELDASSADLDRLRGWSGPASLSVVRSGLRDGAGANIVRVTPGQPFQILGIDLGVPRSVPDAELLRFEIGLEGAAPAVLVDVPAGDARAQIRTTAVVTLAVASASLPPGQYKLSVSRADQPQLPTLFETRIEVVSSTP